MWKAILKGGKIVSEGNQKWSDVKNSIDRLFFEHNDFVFEFPKSDQYIQYKTASASLSGGESELESQTIGCVVENKKFLIKFNVKNNIIQVLVE
jgi:hypothetical protein